MKNALWLISLCFFAAGALAPRYRDKSLPVRERVDDLVERMTVEQKVGQLLHPWNPGGTPESVFSAYGGSGLGACYLFWATNATTAEGMLADRNRLQKMFVEGSPFGIPVSIVMESLHGGGFGGTLFPMPVNFAATFNLSLARQAYRLVGVDARVRGCDRCFSPVVNIFQDARYGRLAEGFSEDPWVTTAFGLAIVDAMQGGQGGGPEAYLKSSDFDVTCTVKHFAGYGRGTGGIDGSPAMVSPQVLNEVYLRPWKALADAGLLRSVMAAQNAVNGVPMHSNANLLNATLRGAWGVSRALVESDGLDCIGALVDFRVAANRSDAAILAVSAGMDQDLGAATLPTLTAAVAAGQVAEDVISRAAAHVLTQKFASGLFDQPYANPAFLNESTLDPPASRQLAREAAQQSITLLLNRNATLPLALVPGVSRVAVLGVNAASEDALKGGYAQDGQRMVTVLAAFQAALGEASVPFAVGADPDAKAQNATRLAEAVALARGSDAVVLVLGDSLTTCGEMYDSSSLELPGAEQVELLKAIVALSPHVPVVVVLLHARTVSFTQGGTLPGVDALLSAWRPGEEGGTAVYDIVSGAVNPSGRLPQAWPLSVGQVNGPASPYLYPFQGDHQWEDYTDASSAPLFPFGWGLSYSTWALSSPTASRSANGSSFELGVTVHNSAGARGPARDGALTVFVFLEDVVCSVVRVASVQLVAFEKTLVPGGGSARVSLTVPTSSMAVWLEERRDFVLEKGDFIFYFSTSGPGQGNAFPPGTQTVRVTV